MKRKVRRLYIKNEDSIWLVVSLILALVIGATIGAIIALRVVGFIEP